MKNILITGGAGFLGSNLARIIKQEHSNTKITIVDDLSSGKFEFIKPYYDQFICEDFTSSHIKGMIAKLNYDIIFHLAAIPRVGYSVDYPSKSNEINVQKSVMLLEGCINKIERFVNISSSSIYGDIVNGSDNEYDFEPKSPYGLQKLTIEKYCKLFSQLYNLDTVSIRPFNIFGPNQLGDNGYSTVVSSWFYKAKRNEPFILHGDGSKMRDMIYVDDVCNIILKAALHKDKQNGETYNTGSSNPIAIKDILEWFRNEFISNEVIYQENRKGEPNVTCANMNKVNDKLQYSVQYNFWNMLEVTKRWCFECDLF